MRNIARLAKVLTARNVYATSRETGRTVHMTLTDAELKANLVRVLAEQAAAEITSLWWMRDHDIGVGSNNKYLCIVDIIERKMLEVAPCN